MAMLTKQRHNGNLVLLLNAQLMAVPVPEIVAQLVPAQGIAVHRLGAMDTKTSENQLIELTIVLTALCCGIMMLAAGAGESANSMLQRLDALAVQGPEYIYRQIDQMSRKSHDDLYAAVRRLTELSAQDILGHLTLAHHAAKGGKVDRSVWAGCLQIVAQYLDQVGEVVGLVNQVNQQVEGALAVADSRRCPMRMLN